MIFGDTIFRPDTCVSEGRTRRTWVGRRCFFLALFFLLFFVFFLNNNFFGVGRDPRRNGVTHRQVDRHPRSKPASLSLAMGGTTPGTHAEMDTRINVHYRQEGICQCPLHASATLGPCLTHPCA